MEALIKELEEATAPSRELDAAIAVTAFPEKYIHCDKPNKPGCVYINHNKTPYHGGDIGPISQCDAPRFTASIDAALALVPEGWWWNVEDTRIGDMNWFGAYLSDCPLVDKDEPATHIPGSSSASPAIALCIAALKARAALSNGKGERDA